MPLFVGQANRLLHSSQETISGLRLLLWRYVEASHTQLTVFSSWRESGMVSWKGLRFDSHEDTCEPEERKGT